MNLIKRFKNLWIWSEIDPGSLLTEKQKLEHGFPVMVEKKPKMSQIIKRSNPTEEFLKNE